MSNRILVLIKDRSLGFNRFTVVNNTLTFLSTICSIALVLVSSIAFVFFLLILSLILQWPLNICNCYSNN